MGKLLSSFVTLLIVLSALVALAAPVTAQPPEPEVAEIEVTANPTNILADRSSTSTITATVTDWKNIASPEGFVIHFEITGDALGTAIGPEYVDTDESGIASTTLTGGLMDGTVTIKASWIGNTSVFNTTSVTLTAPSTIKIYGDVLPQGNAPERYSDWIQPFDPIVIPMDSITFNPAILLDCGCAQSTDIDLKTYLRSWYEPCHEYRGDLGTQKYPAIEMEYTYMIIDTQDKMPFHGGADDTSFPFPIAEIGNQKGLGAFENIEGTAIYPNRVSLTYVDGVVTHYGKTTDGTIRIEKEYLLASGETIQFLDHKLRYNDTDESGNTAYCHLWYAGNVEDDAARNISLQKGQTVFFDRWNNMLTSPSHPDATWYARFEFKMQEGGIAAITVGKELSTGDTFYVNGVRYDVPAIEVLDMNGDTEADVFKFITLRTPLPKGSSQVRDETVVTSQWLDCIDTEEQIPVLPPFNMDHSIVDDINVPLWVPLKHLEKWPEGDPMGMLGLEYFPCAEKYLTMQYPPYQWLKYFCAVPIGAEPTTEWQMWENIGGPFYPGDDLPPYWVMDVCGKILPAPESYTVFDITNWIAMDVSKRIIPDVKPLVMCYVAETEEQRFSTNLLEKLNETGIGTPALHENWTNFDVQSLPDAYTEFILPEVPDVVATWRATQTEYTMSLPGDYLITTSLIAPNSLSNRPVRGGDFPGGRVAFAYDTADMRYSSDIYVNHFENEYNTVRVYGDIYQSAPQRYVNWQDPFDPTVINEDSITFDPAVLLCGPEYPMSAQSENIDLKTHLRAWYGPCYEFNKAKKPAVVAESTYMIIDSQDKMPFHGASNNTWFAFPIAEDETTEQIGLELFENGEGTSVNPNVVKLTHVEGNVEPYGKNLSGKIRLEKKYTLTTGEKVQFLDHKLEFIGTDINGTMAVVKISYAGNKDDDSQKVVILNQNDTYYFDRHNSMYTTPQHPERTWYARYEYKIPDDKAVITVGKELQWGDVFYVDSVRYEVVAIEVIDNTGDGEADKFKYITLRTPFPKDLTNSTFCTKKLDDSGEAATSQWITMIPPCHTIPVLPPFNVDHEIVDDTDVVLWAPLKHLNKWPEGDPYGVPCIEYFPCAERYLTMQYPPSQWLKYFRTVPIDTFGQSIPGIPTDWQLWENYGGPFYPGTELPESWTCCLCGGVMEAPEYYTVFDTTGWIAYDVAERIVSPVAPLEFWWVSETKEVKYSTNLLQVLNETVTGEEPVIEDWTKLDIQTLPDLYTEFKLPVIPSIRPIVYVGGDYQDFFKPDVREDPGSYLITTSLIAPYAKGDFTDQNGTRFAFTYNASYERGIYTYTKYSPPSISPIANFTCSPENPIINQTITFNASNSTDPDGTIIKYEWTFGDGTNGTGEILNHSYSLQGNYTVILTVTDDDSAMNSTNKTIVISKPTIVKVEPASQTVSPGQNFSVNVTVENVTNMNADGAALHFNATVMLATDIIEGEFLKSGGPTFPIEEINNTAGTATFAYSLGAGSSVNGSGVLATIEFTAKASVEGTFDLNFTELHLVSSDGTEIPTEVFNGTVTISIPPALVKVIPETQTVSAGNPFHVNITVENVTNMGADQATLNFDSSVMSVSNVTEGAFLKSAGTTIGAGMEDTDNVNGSVTFFYALTTPGIGVTGSGTLATIYFDTNASAEGTFNLNLSGVVLANGTGGSIPVELFNGTVNLIPFSLNITSPGNKTYASTCVRLNFTVEPEGTVLDWIAYRLDGGANVTIAGNTTVSGLSVCGHNIVVYARDSNGNMAASNTVYFAMHPGDINGDRVVNVFDLQRLAWAFNSQSGDLDWNENADLNCDNKVNVFDLQILAWNFGNDYTVICGGA